MTEKEFVETYQLEEGYLVFEPWDDFKYGIVGVTEDRNHVVYGYQAMVESLGRAYEKYYYEKNKNEVYDADRFTQFLDEAVEWIDCNTLRSLPYYDANRRPIIMMETDLEI